MASTPEKKVKDAVKRLLDQYGAYHFSPVMNGMGRSGIPDIIACVRGHFLAIECKAGKNTTTALQDRELHNIRTAQGWAIVVNENSIDALRLILDAGEADASGDKDTD